MTQTADRTSCNIVTGLIIAKNEELCIERAIQSINWLDQVIVLDTGSTDRTIKISEKNGATIIRYPYPKFEQTLARNLILEKVDLETPWIFILDADEICTNELAESICETVHHCDENIGLFRLAGKYIFLGRWMKHSMRFPAWHDRLIRVGAGRFYGTIPHEKFVCHEDYVSDHLVEPYVHDALVHGVDAWLSKHVYIAERLSGAIFKYIGNQSSVEYSDELFREGKPVKVRAFFHRHGLGYILPLAAFLNMYVFRKGFLDGKQGLLLSFMFAVFEAMVSARVAERRLSSISAGD